MSMTKNNSTLNSTKSDTFQFYSFSQILKESMNKISTKYSTSQSYHVANNIELVIQNKKCKLKQFLKDQQHNKEDQILEQYYDIKQCSTEITQLTQYYKYYTQTSILYQIGYFKMMHAYREKKKVYQYNKLKVLLNLSSTTEQSSTSERKNKPNLTPFSSFYILSKLSQTNRDEESMLIVKLNNKLSQEYGPNHYRTIQQLDQNYYFQKKTYENHGEKVEKMFRKIKTVKVQKQKQKQNNNGSFLKSKSRFQGKRNNSCESLAHDSNKKISIKHREYKKKKHLSMDNADCYGKEEFTMKEIAKINQKYGKQKEHGMALIGNWMKSNEKIKSSKVTEKKISHNLKSNAYQIKEKILLTKEKIKQQKRLLKKKTIVSNKSGQDPNGNKKIISLLYSEKNSTRNFFKIHP